MKVAIFCTITYFVRGVAVTQKMPPTSERCWHRSAETVTCSRRCQGEDRRTTIDRQLDNNSCGSLDNHAKTDHLILFSFVETDSPNHFQNDDRTKVLRRVSTTECSQLHQHDLFYQHLFTTLSNVVGLFCFTWYRLLWEFQFGFVCNLVLDINSVLTRSYRSFRLLYFVLVFVWTPSLENSRLPLRLGGRYRV